MVPLYCVLCVGGGGVVPLAPVRDALEFFVVVVAFIREHLTLENTSLFFFFFFRFAVSILDHSVLVCRFV